MDFRIKCNNEWKDHTWNIASALRFPKVYCRAGKRCEHDMDIPLLGKGQDHALERNSRKIQKHGLH